MSNSLTRLLETPSAMRTVEDYERTFDDFIAFAGGRRLEEAVDIPPGVLNADYLVEIEAIDLVVEVKQVNAYAKAKSVDRYFEKLLDQRQLRDLKQISAIESQIAPDSLTTAQWNNSYAKFRPNVPRHLDKAARQLKSTAELLPPWSKRRAYGAILVNTGDFNLPVDLMHRLVEFHTKRKWKAGRFSHVDFVMCVMMDMIKMGQHPLHGRCLVRTLDDMGLTEGGDHLYDRWIRYDAAAIGTEVVFEPTGHSKEAPLQLSSGITGKIVKSG